MNNTVQSLNVSSGSVSSEYPAPFNSGLSIAIVIVLAVEILIGFPGNLKVCCFLYKRKDLRKATHVLLGNLSLIGSLVSAIYIPLFISINVMDQFFRKPLHVSFCIVRYSSSVLFFGLQTLSLVTMAIDRHDAVVRPYKRRITATNVRKVVRGIWLFTGLTVAVHLPLAINDAVDNCHIYTLHRTVSRLWIIALGNIYLFGTVIVIFTSFVRIVKRLQASPFAESNQSSELQVTRFSFMLLFFFIISWLPISSFSIITLLTGFASPEVEGIKVLLLAISNTNYVVNPFVHMNIIRASQRTGGPTEMRNNGKDRRQGASQTVEQDRSEQPNSTS